MDNSSNQAGKWWTSPTESSETGNLIMVTGREDIDRFRNNPRFKYRVDISLPYTSGPDGMPDETTAMTLESVTDSLQKTFHKDPVAVITGIYTGDGRRDWVCYTLSLHIFQKKINEALVELPLLPLQFHAEEDPQWSEYTEMRTISHISTDDDD